MPDYWHWLKLFLSLWERNIGTTVTAWIMSVFGFQIDMNNLIFPLFALAVPLIFSNKSQKSLLENLYLALRLCSWDWRHCVKIAMHMDLEHNAAILGFITSCKEWGFFVYPGVPFDWQYHNYVCPIIGGSNGYYFDSLFEWCAWLVFGYSLVMGENIGTTCNLE